MNIQPVEVEDSTFGATVTGVRLAHARASVPWQPLIEKILTHLGLQARAPPTAFGASTNGPDYPIATEKGPLNELSSCST